MFSTLLNLMAETVPSIPVVPIGDYAKWGSVGWLILGGVIATTIVAVTWRTARAGGTTTTCRADSLTPAVADLAQAVTDLRLWLADGYARHDEKLDQIIRQTERRRAG